MQAAVSSPEDICASENGLNPTASSNLCTNINSCVISELMPLGLHFKIQITLKGQNRSASAAAMVDCGATTLFISKHFVKTNHVHMHLLSHEIPLYNINGSRNRAGSITCTTRLQLQVGDTEEWHQFLVTDLGPEDIVLGLPWLRSTNPKIDWRTGKMRIDSAEEGPAGGNAVKEKPEDTSLRIEKLAVNREQRRQWWKKKILDDPSETLWCAAGYTYSAELAEKAD